MVLLNCRTDRPLYWREKNFVGWRDGEQVGQPSHLGDNGERTGFGGRCESSFSKRSRTTEWVATNEVRVLHFPRMRIKEVCVVRPSPAQ